MSLVVNNSRFRRITPGIETLPCNFSLPRHRHLDAYATVVLAGCFEESGYNGRIHATAGDVLIHPALDCHGNQMVSAGVKLIRLDWQDGSGVGGLYHLDDVDELARAAEKDFAEATHLLKSALWEKCSPSPGEKNDWPDLLLAALAKNASTEIGAWAERNGLARETVSRGFAAAYSIAPSVYAQSCGPVRLGCLCVCIDPCVHRLKHQTRLMMTRIERSHRHPRVSRFL